MKKNRREDKWLPISLLVSSFVDGGVFYGWKEGFSEVLAGVFPVLTYFFVFLHIGLDKIFLSYIGIGKFFFFLFLSILYGLGSVLLEAGGAVGAVLLEDKKLSLSFLDSVRAIGMYHFIPAAVAFIGVLLRVVIGWSSLIFGVSAVLITLIPYWTFLKKQFSKKIYAVATVSAVGFLLCLAVTPLLFTKFL